MKYKTVTITKKGWQWYRTGHAWIYRDDIAKKGNAAAGDIVEVVDGKGRFLGKAFYSDRSKITLRMISRSRGYTGVEFWQKRLKEACERRASLAGNDMACRLVYSEGDRIPGLIVDRYAGWLVMQTLIPGTEARLDLFAEILGELCAPDGIFIRNDAQSRSLEGLPRETRVLRGAKPGPIEVVEGDISYLADLRGGHKTGVYLDQRENRIITGRYARGEVLDSFSYHGHFSLHMARNAKRVIAIESSRDAVAMIEKNAALNRIKNIEAVRGNVFDSLRRYHKEGKKFDVIVLDPPPLARRRRHVEDAGRAYKEINLRAMHLLKRGGILATFCCSHGISRDLFFEVVRLAAADARSGMRVLHEFIQPADHPVLLHVPETAYLKGVLCEKI